MIVIERYDIRKLEDYIQNITQYKSSYASENMSCWRVMR